MAVQQTSELKPVSGIEMVGPLQTEVQKISVFSGGNFAHAAHLEAARRLIAYLGSAEAESAIREKGIEPGRSAV